jgi:hypothetical protein
MLNKSMLIGQSREQSAAVTTRMRGRKFTQRSLYAGTKEPGSQQHSLAERQV